MTHIPQKAVNIFEEVRKLGFSSEQFIVIGSGIMAVRGIRDAYDLDIVVSQELFDICESNGWELKPWTHPRKIGKHWLKKGKIELMTDIQSGDEDYDLERLKKEGELINNVWFISLSQLIKLKRNYGRPKDFNDINLMEEYLKKYYNLSI